MDFSLEQTRFDAWVVLQQRRGLIRAYSEDVNSPQLALNTQRKQSGHGQISLGHHLFDESRMLLDHEIKAKRVRFPLFSPLQENKGILLHSRRLGWIVNRARVDEPRPMHLGEQTACLDCGIAVGPLLCLLR
jgi:hypothetical protein